MQVFYRRSTQERSGIWTHRIVVDHADLTEATANTAQAITLLSLPAHSAVLNAGFYLEVPFEDADDAAFNTTTLTVGDAGSANRLITSRELNKNGTEILSAVSAGATSTLPHCYTTATDVTATFGSMSAKSLSNLDLGKIHILLEVTNLATVL